MATHILWSGIIHGTCRVAVFTLDDKPAEILYELKDNLTALESCCQHKNPWLQGYKPAYETGTIDILDSTKTAEEAVEFIIECIVDRYCAITSMLYAEEITRGLKH